MGALTIGWASMTMADFRIWILAASCGALLAGCNVLFGDGRVNLAVTDAPIDDATAVVISVRKIVFTDDNDDRETFEFSPEVIVDLASLEGGAVKRLLENRELAPGRYKSIRFELRNDESTTDSYVDLADGRRLPLYVPDEAKSRLTLATDFSIDERDTIDLTVDFDLRAAVRDGGGVAYEFWPALRWVRDDDAGSVSGSVAASLIDASDCVPVVYVYVGKDVTPDDIDEIGVEPLTSARVRQNSTNGNGSYTAAFLEAGAYTLALTCDAALDEPDQSDAIEFLRTRNFEVKAERTTTLDLS